MRNNILKHKTFCNPIVLPDYPNLQVMNTNRDHRGEPDPWKRDTKKFLSETDILYEAGIVSEVESKYSLDVYSPRDKRSIENDVRATADPSVLYYDNHWYLYCSSGNIYSSENFADWTVHHEETWLPVSFPMAPTVEAFKGKFYATANAAPLHVADTPTGPWRKVGEFTLPDGREMLCNDPMIFADGEELYLYWGLGMTIFGAKLNPEQPNQLITAPKQLIIFQPQNSWERFGASNEDWQKGYIEGAWMVKANGEYYLIYSAAGTEYYSYCMGAYKSDAPLGEFTLQERNPVSQSRSGLIQGGGHGCIVKGPKDTLWCFYTIPINYDNNMERRIGMDPAGIDEEGNLFALTGTDVPQWAPGVIEHPEKGNRTGAAALSIFKPCTVSSYRYGRNPLYAVDEAMHTWWEPVWEGEKQYLEVNLQGLYCISSVRIMWKDVGLNFGAGIFPGPYRYTLEALEDKKEDSWVMLVDAADNEVDLAVDYREFGHCLTKRVRLTIIGAPEGVYPGLMNLTVFGESAYKNSAYEE